MGEKLDQILLMYFICAWCFVWGYVMRAKSDREGKRLRWSVRTLKRSSDGRPQYAIGVRVGWWPCLHGPFIQVCFGTRIFDLWYGYPSYSNFEK